MIARQPQPAGLVASAPRAARVPVREFLVRHPVVAYFVLAFAGTWLLDAPLVLGKTGLGLLPFSVPLALYAALFVAGAYAGPTLAAYTVTAATSGRAGGRQFFRRYGQWRVGVRWYLLVLFGYPLIALVAATAWLGAAPWQALLANWPLFFTTYLPAVLIFPALVTWGEEPGWRGFALTQLQRRYGPLAASLIVGLFHGVWHLPIFLLVSGPVAAGPFSAGRFAVNTLSIVIITITWTWVFNNAGGSILIAVLLHASFNATGAWMGQLIPQDPSGAAYLTLGIYVAVSALLVICTRGRLSYRPDRQDPGAATPPPTLPAR